MVNNSTVAIVDDNDSMRRLTARILKREGWESESFASGDEFLADPGAVGFAAILLDLRMPGRDGLAVLKAVRARDNPPPVIVLTGHGGIRAAVEAMRLGAFNFLEKPYPANDLVAAIGQAVATHSELPAHKTAEAGAAIKGLSERQRQVLCGILQGDANKIIAYRLGLSIRTIEAYRAQLLTKLGVRNTAGAVRAALAANLDCSIYGAAQREARSAD